MNSISALIKPRTNKKSNCGPNSSIESTGFLYTNFLHLFYRMAKKSMLNLNTHVQINKIEWIG